MCLNIGIPKVMLKSQFIASSLFKFCTIRMIVLKYDGVLNTEEEEEECCKDY